MGRRIATALVLAVLLMVGCSQSSKRADTAFKDCGSEHAREGPAYNDVGRECLWQAYLDGTRARFSATGFTVEGDPIVHTVHVLGANRVQIIYDNTNDKWAAEQDRRVWTFTCKTVQRVPVAFNADGETNRTRLLFVFTSCDNRDKNGLKL